MNEWDRLERAAKRKGLRPRGVARALGMSASAMHEWKTAGIPGQRLAALSALLDVPPEWLTTGHPRQPWEDCCPAGNSGQNQITLALTERAERLAADLERERAERVRTEAALSQARQQIAELHRTVERLTREAERPRRRRPGT
jgi:chromosome segregation ATPase